MKERIALVAGLRTPFCKAGGQIKHMKADELGAVAVRELMARLNIDDQMLDELIVGNVAMPGDAANIARIVGLKAGLRQDLIAYTVHRNCASGMEAITTAANKILAGEAEIIMAAGTESMSHIPLLFNRKATAWFEKLARARTFGQRLGVMLGWRPSFMSPIIGVKLGLTDPVCGLNMGETAEVLARDFHITRHDQDAFALESHQRACRAQAAGVFAEESVPLMVAPDYQKRIEADDGPRPQQSLEALGKLRPVFNRDTGTVTAGNACPLTDGAAAMLVMRESKAKELGLEPLGYLRDYAYAALAGTRMGLGPVYATAKLLAKTGGSMSDFQRIEINEAFAAQAIACGKAYGSDEYAKTHLNRDKAVGELDWSITNVNGGAIALGHPVGTTGMRLVLTLLHELRRSNNQRGLATLCIGGGQGAALDLEVA